MPTLVSAPAAVGLVAERSLMTPEKVVETLLPPIVSVVALGVAPAFPKTTLAAPAPLLASEAMLGAVLVKSTVAVPGRGVENQTAGWRKYWA